MHLPCEREQEGGDLALPQEQGHECFLHDTGMLDNLVPCPLWEAGSWISFLCLAVAEAP